MSPLRPIDVLLTRKIADATQDGVVTKDEVKDLAVAATDSRRSTKLAKPELVELVEKNASRFESGDAQAAARALIDVPESQPPRPDNPLFRYQAPAGNNTLRLHDLYIKGNGTIEGDTGLSSYSRGWGQFNLGVLNEAHGSPLPASALHDSNARSALQRLSPGQRLDAAAAAFGVKLPASGFDELSRTAFSRPDQPDWAGVCYSWSWAALDARLSQLVDVSGPQGERGLWAGGQWLSRADLGNWMMALASGLSQGAGDVMWWAPESEDLLKAALGYLMDGGPGFRADIGPAVRDGSEVWFQPFVGAKVDISAVIGAAEAGILDVVKQPRQTNWGGTVPGLEGAAVKLVRIAGRYGDEQGDDWEGAPSVAEMTWAVYAVLDDQGKVLTALSATDPRLASVPNLPERESNETPRTLFAPDHELIDGILAGDPAPEVRNSVFGPALDFFVGHVLARGVPGPLRGAFEAEPALQGRGPLAADQIARLRERYPTIANAYSPAEWATHFAPRGLDAAVFGAPEYSS